MGALADGALGGGGEVVGVIPEMMVGRELAHEGIGDLRVVGSMHERKATMADLADAFVALPGGIGTLEELFEIWTWGQLGLHRKPCGVLDVGGYYSRLLDFLAHAHESRLHRRRHHEAARRRERPRAAARRAGEPPPAGGAAAARPREHLSRDREADTMHARAADLIETLGLQPHPEGGWFREVYRSTDVVTRDGAARDALTSIYYLLAAGQLSRWHVVTLDEVWHFHEGEPLELLTCDPREGRVEVLRLGPVASDGARPQHVVAPRRLAGGAPHRRLLARRLHGGARLRLRRLPVPRRPARCRTRSFGWAALGAHESLR